MPAKPKPWHLNGSEMATKVVLSVLLQKQAAAQAAYTKKSRLLIMSAKYASSENDLKSGLVGLKSEFSKALDTGKDYLTFLEECEGGETDNLKAAANQMIEDLSRGYIKTEQSVKEALWTKFDEGEAGS